MDTLLMCVLGFCVILYLWSVRGYFFHLIPYNRTHQPVPDCNFCSNVRFEYKDNIKYYYCKKHDILSQSWPSETSWFYREEICPYYCPDYKKIEDNKQHCSKTYYKYLTQYYEFLDDYNRKEKIINSIKLIIFYCFTIAIGIYVIINCTF